MSPKSLFDTYLFLVWTGFITEEWLLESLASFFLRDKKSTKIFDADICMELCLVEPTDFPVVRFGDRWRHGVGGETVGFELMGTGVISTWLTANDSMASNGRVFLY